MKPAQLARHAALRGAFLFALPTVATAQNQVWIRQFGTSGGEGAYATAPDGSGGVFVSGITAGSLGGPHAGRGDAWLARFDGGGNQIWIRQFGTSQNDWPRAATTDGWGGVFVSGVTYGSFGGPSAGSVFLARYDSAGNPNWIRQFGTGTLDLAYACAPDGASGVYVSGITGDSLGGQNAGFTDAWVARYDGGLNASRYCTPAVPNSTGNAGTMNATGSNSVQANDVTLVASRISLNSFGFFITSRDQGNTFPVSNSQGRLCLGGFIGRYVAPGQIKNSGTSGSFSLAIDLTVSVRRG